MTNQPHARAFDLPGWPCPPRVRDIPNHDESWGWIAISPHSNISHITVAQDELGYLWANGDTVPAFRLPNGEDANPGAIVFRAEQGIGLYVHEKSLRYLPSISRLDMQEDQWIPVAQVAADLPKWILKLA